ncbi:MAG: SHOCT domain-containing protein [Ruminococcus sp.]|nr:SHOCT domain-containing protein [Ruminococcus sp.]
MGKSVSNEKKSVDLTSVITTAIQIPGVKVSRESFLRGQFSDLEPETISLIIEKGPVVAGCDKKILKKKAQRIIKECTAISTSASFAAGLPGGFAMVATIPADMIQFYGVALRMAQQLVYLYGEEDMWCEGTPDQEKITNQLILYCGVMLGATGAAQTVRVMSSALAKQALKKLPQKALTKTFYYPVIKSILKFFGVQVTKSTFAKGVSKAIPVVGGVVSGGLTLASMLPMGNRLVDALEKAHFDYDAVDMETDMDVIMDVCDEIIEEEIENTHTDQSDDKKVQLSETIFAQIKEAKCMLDEGIITEEEFEILKVKLINQL